MIHKKILLWAILLAWTLYHASFLHLNEVLKVADSFAYLQMSHFLQNLSQSWLGNGWFGFIYSLPLSLATLFIENERIASQIVNLILFNISAVLLWKIGQKILNSTFSYVLIILFFLSPTLLHFNIHILSENIYIPLFLGLFLITLYFIENIWKTSKISKYKSVVSIACLIWLMYLTRAEAFIYIGSIWIISWVLLYKKSINFRDFMSLGIVFFISFFVFVSPYLFHLHSLTGEWWLTNKWASNLRQAELRWQERLDDDGFERAVAELTDDKHHLIAWFAGWMPYDTPSIEWSLMSFISKDPSSFIQRVLVNQKKLYTQNIPEIFLGKSPGLYYSDDTRFSHIPFLLWSILPMGILVFWIHKLIRREKDFFTLSLSFFIPAAIFFTLFFTLNRYFLIFYPLLLIAFCYGVQNITVSPFVKGSTLKGEGLLQMFFIVNLISVLLLSTFVYANTEKSKDEYYALKQEAGEWLRSETASPENLKIMERFPIVTYYSWSKIRYITPYTHDIADIYEYAIYNNLDFLIVDTMDFQTYRPKLESYLETTPQGFKKIKDFSNRQWQKVILYQVVK